MQTFLRYLAFTCQLVLINSMKLYGTLVLPDLLPTFVKSMDKESMGGNNHLRQSNYVTTSSDSNTKKKLQVYRFTLVGSLLLFATIFFYLITRQILNLSEFLNYNQMQLLKVDCFSTNLAVAAGIAAVGSILLVIGAICTIGSTFLGPLVGTIIAAFEGQRKMPGSIMDVITSAFSAGSVLGFVYGTSTAIITAIVASVTSCH